MSQCLIFQLLDGHTGGDKNLGAEPEDIGSTGNGNDAAEPIVVVQTEAHEHRHHSDATMNDIQYFIIYLRDISDYHTVDRMMQQFYPQIPRIIVEAKVCRPGWLIEMECIAEKE